LTNSLQTQWLVEELSLSLSLSLHIFILFYFLNSIFLHQVSKRRELGFWLDGAFGLMLVAFLG